MKSYELSRLELVLVVDALRRDIEEDCECWECLAMRALIDRLDPKPVQKEGWILKDQLISIWHSKPTEDLEMFQRITWED